MNIKKNTLIIALALNITNFKNIYTMEQSRKNDTTSENKEKPKGISGLLSKYKLKNEEEDKQRFNKVKECFFKAQEKLMDKNTNVNDLLILFPVKIKSIFEDKKNNEALQESLKNSQSFKNSQFLKNSFSDVYVQSNESRLNKIQEDFKLIANNYLKINDIYNKNKESNEINVLINTYAIMKDRFVEIQKLITYDELEKVININLNNINKKIILLFNWHFREIDNNIPENEHVHVNDFLKIKNNFNSIKQLYDGHFENILYLPTVFIDALSLKISQKLSDKNSYFTKDFKNRVNIIRLSIDENVNNVEGFMELNGLNKEYVNLFQNLWDSKEEKEEYFYNNILKKIQEIQKEKIQIKTYDKQLDNLNLESQKANGDKSLDTLLNNIIELKKLLSLLRLKTEEDLMAKQKTINIFLSNIFEKKMKLFKNSFINDLNAKSLEGFYFVKYKNAINNFCKIILDSLFELKNDESSKKEIEQKKNGIITLITLKKDEFTAILLAKNIEKEAKEAEEKIKKQRQEQEESDKDFAQLIEAEEIYKQDYGLSEEDLIAFFKEDRPFLSHQQILEEIKKMRNPNNNNNYQPGKELKKEEPNKQEPKKFDFFGALAGNDNALVNEQSIAKMIADYKENINVLREKNKKGEKNLLPDIDPNILDAIEKLSKILSTYRPHEKEHYQFIENSLPYDITHDHLKKYFKQLVTNYKIIEDNKKAILIPKSAEIKIDTLINKYIEEAVKNKGISIVNNFEYDKKKYNMQSIISKVIEKNNIICQQNKKEECDDKRNININIDVKNIDIFTDLLEFAQYDESSNDVLSQLDLCQSLRFQDILQILIPSLSYEDSALILKNWFKSINDNKKNSIKKSLILFAKDMFKSMEENKQNNPVFAKILQVLKKNDMMTMSRFLKNDYNQKNF